MDTRPGRRGGGLSKSPAALGSAAPAMGRSRHGHRPGSGAALRCNHNARGAAVHRALAYSGSRRRGSRADFSRAGPGGPAPYILAVYSLQHSSFRGPSDIVRMARHYGYGADAGGATAAYRGVGRNIRILSSVPGFELLVMRGGYADLGYHMVTVAAAAIVPLLAALAFVIVSRINRVPVSVALICGFRGCAAPLAGLLFLTDAALLPFTLRLEHATDDSIRQTLQHEGLVFAGFAGKEWPGRDP